MKSGEGVCSRDGRRMGAEEREGEGGGLPVSWLA